jgi:PKHD-type hydroxylase
MLYPTIRPASKIHEQSYAWWDGAFSPDDLKKIIQLGYQRKPEQATTIGTPGKSEIRDSLVSWIEPAKDTVWIYDKLAGVASDVNDQFFGFDLSAFEEKLQFTVYDSKEGEQHYDWHIDSLGKGTVQRKLSAVMLLSDPMDFEGGDLWINGFRRETLPKVKGRVYFFPSYTQHRVTPVTQGVRRSLVSWIIGPEFR